MTPHKKYLIASLVLTLLVLAIYRATYFRPFFTNPESSESYRAMNRAQALRAGVFGNPFNVRSLDLERSEVVVERGWINPYLLTLSGWTAIFGQNERAGRAYAVLVSLVALYLLAAAVGHITPMAYLAVPVVLISGLGRYAIPALAFTPMLAIVLLSAFLIFAFQWGKSKGER